MCDHCVNIYRRFLNEESGAATQLYWGVTRPEKAPILARRILSPGGAGLVGGGYAAIVCCQSLLLTDEDMKFLGGDAARFVNGIGVASPTLHSRGKGRYRESLDFAAWCLRALRDKTDDCDLTEAYSDALVNGNLY